MSKLAGLSLVLVAVCGSIASCGGDDKARRVAASDAGAAGAEAGTGPAHSGGGSGLPTPEQGGAGSGNTESGGAPNAGGSSGGTSGGGGAAGAAGLGGNGGKSETGAGGAPAIVCQPQVFKSTCVEVSANWSPTYTTADRKLHFDLSDLPFPIESGSMTLQFTGIDSQDCAILPIAINGNELTVTVGSRVVPAPVSIDVFTFTLTDVCGSTYVYEPFGNVCNDLHGEGQPGTWTLKCKTDRGGACPGQCT